MTGGRFIAAPADDATVAELGAAQRDNPFATVAYADSRRRVGYAVWLLALRGADGDFATGCLGLLTTGRLNRTLEIPSLPALGVDGAFWSGLGELCRSRGVTTLALDTFASPAGTVIPELWARSTRRDRQEFVVDLVGEASTRLGSNHKRNVKKAQKAGLQLTRTRGSDAVAVHHALMTSSLDRRRTRGEEVSDAAASKDHRAFLESQAGELFQAVSGTTVLSSVLVLRAATSGYYQSAGTSAEGMATGASHFLIHAIGQALQSEGATTFNLGGADEGSSLARFKEGFGARCVGLPSAQCEVGPHWRRVATRAIEWVRRDRAAVRPPSGGE